jgi:uncharacterized membrane protein
MGRPVAAIVGLVLIASAVAVAPATGSSGGSSMLAQPDGFDRTVFDVTVSSNGTALWVFEHRQILESDEDEADFRAYADAFESAESDLYRDFVNQTGALAHVGTRQTGREMAAGNHARSASVDTLGQTEGVVRMSFEWTNFAESTDSGPVVADVFAGGLALGEDQRIVFQGGPAVTFGSVQPDAYTPSGENLTTSDSITFFGPMEFADRRPRVEFVPAATADPTEAGPDRNVVIVIALLGIVIGAVAALAWRFDFIDRFEAASRDGKESTSTPTPQPEIKSDSDRVIDLLQSNGGRMKQVNIVDQTDWSKSKVSMLLSDMEEDGDITKLRVGRENIVSLAGEEPDAAGSPFEDDE